MAPISDTITGARLVVPAKFAQCYLASLKTLHFFALGAVAFVYFRRDKAGLLFAVTAAPIREWFVSALIGGIAGHVQRRRWRDAALWGAALVLVMGVYALNIWLAWRYLRAAGVVVSPGTAGWLWQGGPLFILYTLQFNAAFYAHAYVVPYLIFFLGLVGCVALIRRRAYYLPSLVFVPLLFFMFAGSGHRPGDPCGMDVYYSGAFLPFIVIAACCADQILRPGVRDRKCLPWGLALIEVKLTCLRLGLATAASLGSSAHGVGQGAGRAEKAAI